MERIRPEQLTFLLLKKLFKNWCSVRSKNLGLNGKTWVGVSGYTDQIITMRLKGTAKLFSSEDTAKSKYYFKGVNVCDSIYNNIIYLVCHLKTITFLKAVLFTV